MSKKRLTRIQRGFTLIEAVAAIVIVTLGLIAVLGTFSMGNKVIALRRDRIAAAHLLEHLMEAAKSWPFDKFIDRAPSECTLAAPGCNPASSDAGICAQLNNCQYEVKKQDYNTSLKLKRVDVSVTWDPKGGQSSQRETVTTIIADR